jgi:hypothetical protein
MQSKYLRSGLALLLVSTLAALVETGCKSSDCTARCPCPASFEGPGWCNTSGPGPCCCETSNLCPGWCLPNSHSTSPVPCDGGTTTTDAKVD